MGRRKIPLHDDLHRGQQLHRSAAVPEENDVPPEGKFAHLALATDDTDGCVARVREAGYEITIEPKDVELSDITARIAFCTGPCGEIVEFFDQK